MDCKVNRSESKERRFILYHRFPDSSLYFYLFHLEEESVMWYNFPFKGSSTAGRILYMKGLEMLRENVIKRSGKSRKPPTPFVGIKPYGKSQFNSVQTKNHQTMKGKQ